MLEIEYLNIDAQSLSYLGNSLFIVYHLKYKHLILGVKFSSSVHTNVYEDENSCGDISDIDEEEFRKRVTTKRRPSGMLNLSKKDNEALR